MQDANFFTSPAYLTTTAPATATKPVEQRIQEINDLAEDVKGYLDFISSQESTEEDPPVSNEQLERQIAKLTRIESSLDDLEKRIIKAIKQ